MKHILSVVFVLINFYAFAQEPQLVKQYNRDSTLMGTGVVDGVVKTGLWKFYNPKTNNLIFQGTYKLGQRDGEWITYYPDGKKKQSISYREDKPFGPAMYYDTKGALLIEMVFQDSIPVGKYTEYWGKANSPDYVNPKQVRVEGQYENGLKSGQWVTYYEFGELAISEFYVNGLKEGPYLEYDPDGNLITEAFYVKGEFDGSFKTYSFPNLPLEVGTYKRGKKVGEWKRYFPGSKVLEAVEKYDENGNRNGTWTYYYSNSRVARKEIYENNIATGTWEEYFENKNLAKRQSFELGVPVGPYIEYHESGDLSVQGQYENGAKSGLWKSYFPDGGLYSVGEYKNDLKTGLWKYFNKIGILIAEGEYILGMENGQWFYYYDGGQLKSVGAYKLGFEEGTWGLFYDNKTLTQEEFWENGRLMNVGPYFSYDGEKELEKGTLTNGNGTRITYYVTGQKESEGNYKSGKAEGVWTFYHENGRKASEGAMVNGKKEGPWKYYNTAGRLEDLINFKEDEIVVNSSAPLIRN